MFIIEANYQLYQGLLFQIIGNCSKTMVVVHTLHTLYTILDRVKTLLTLLLLCINRIL